MMCACGKKKRAHLLTLAIERNYWNCYFCLLTHVFHIELYLSGNEVGARMLTTDCGKLSKPSSQKPTHLHIISLS